MKYILIAIFASGGFSAEFNNIAACNKAVDSLISAHALDYVWCTPKGEDSITAAAREARSSVFEFVDKIQGATP